MPLYTQLAKQILPEQFTQTQMSIYASQNFMEHSTKLITYFNTKQLSTDKTEMIP